MKDRVAKVGAWFNTVEHEILHYWDDGDTTYVVARANGKLYFLRVFDLGGNIEISCDSQVDN